VTDLPRRLARLPGRRLAGGLLLATAASARARLLGLALLDEMPREAALRIPRCRSVHTFGMRFAVDVLFLDGAGRVLHVAEHVPPRRVLACARAREVLEARAGCGARFAAALAYSDGPRAGYPAPA
jgi:uncharacterized protein